MRQNSYILAAFVASALSAQTVFIPGGTGGVAASNTAYVGIGTNAPITHLHVTSNANPSTGFVLENTGTGGRSFGIVSTQDGAGIGGGRFSIVDLAVAHRLTIDSSGNVGLGATSPEAALDVPGRTLKLSNLRPEYRLDFGGGTDLNWKTIANVTLGSGLFVGANFVVQILDADNNFGAVATARTLTYHVAMTRSAAVQDDYNDAEVSGPSGDYVRVVKTATGAYELQVRQPGEWKRITVSARAHAINSLGSGGSIAYVAAPATGSSSGSIYTATALHTDYFAHAVFGGNVGIGTATPSHELAVNGTIRAKEVIVDTGWADHVFADGYRLAPLPEVEAHIREKRHLPGIPSAAEVAEQGISLGEMQAKLLEKIEELTLHVIELEKKNAAFASRLRDLERKDSP